MKPGTSIERGGKSTASRPEAVPPAELQYREEAGSLAIRASGDWTFDQAPSLDRSRGEVLAAAGRLKSESARIQIEDLTALDTSGAWLLHKLDHDLRALGWAVEMPIRDPRHDALLAEVRRATFDVPDEPAPNSGVTRLVATLGKETLDACTEGARLLSFFGWTILTLGRSLLRPSRLRLTSLTHHLEQTCLNALPIVGLIAFLIGVVMAYQGADQLKRFGAEIFTVDLLGVSILREIGILLTSIVVAGRSGSAFTAEIGAMSVNQEIDALRALGLDVVEVLVLPRMLALMIALPLLAFFANILGLFGGGLMTWLALGITPGQFLTQLDSAISPSTFWVGMVKAPVFAFLIALVGCYQGLLVSGSADSVGRHTTQSVVIGIFLVIVFDALFSILFSYLGI
jgi:phospholipid/cholesterol/gamma-HCH transport system permease protein